MIDQSTKKRLVVYTAGDAGAYIIVPVEQIDAVAELLTDHGVPHWIDETAVSLDDGPATVVVNLGYAADPDLVQQLLDCAK